MTADVTSALALLAELTLDGVETGFRDGRLYCGGRHEPDESQELRYYRHRELIPRLTPWLAPIEWPSTASVSRILTDTILRRIEGMRPIDWPIYVSHRQVYHHGWCAQWGVS